MRAISLAVIGLGLANAVDLPQDIYGEEMVLSIILLNTVTIYILNHYKGYLYRR